MRTLYIYPHPDDESFGPAHAMAKQRRQGHEVHLLTLTRGGATRQRHRLGYSVEEMGEVRYREMLCVEKVLDLNGMRVLDLPDSGLKEMDPREIEAVLRGEIEGIDPDVVVTYAVHGISGFHDHLVCHAVVKRVHAELRETTRRPKRLAFITLRQEDAEKSRHFHLSGSADHEIDCVLELEEEDIRANLKALDCYETFQETIVQSGVRDFVTAQTVFELYRESFDPPLGDLFEELPD